MLPVIRFILFLFVVFTFPFSVNGQENLCDSLLESTYNGNFYKTQMVLKRGAKSDCFSEDGITPLLFAVDRRDINLILLLLDNGAHINLKALNQEGETPLLLAVKSGSAEIANLLLDKGADVNCTDYSGNTPLLYAAFYNDSLLVSLLLSYGADVNIAGNDGLTPLMHAAYNGCNDVIPLLVQNGAIVNKADRKGYTALMYATQNSKYQTSEILLENWANCRIHAKDGKTAFSIAITKNDSALVNLFLNSGANVNEEYSLSLRPFSLSKIYASEAIQDTIKRWGGRSNLLPDFSSSRGLGFITRFNSKEWQLGAKMMFHDSKFNIETSVYFAFRTFAIPVLVAYTDSYFQFWERKNIFGYSLGKSFLINREQNSSYLFLEALCEYQFGRYRGTKISIDNGFKLKPSIGYELISKWFITRLSGYYSFKEVPGNVKWGIELDFMLHLRNRASFIQYKPVE